MLGWAGLQDGLQVDSSAKGMDFLLALDRNWRPGNGSLRAWGCSRKLTFQIDNLPSTFLIGLEEQCSVTPTNLQWAT